MSDSAWYTNHIWIEGLIYLRRCRYSTLGNSVKVVGTSGRSAIGLSCWKKIFDPVRAVREAQQFATPPFLQVPGQRPAVAGPRELDIAFPGGPLLAFKVAEDNQRLILRFWSVVNGAAKGSLRLPSGWSRAGICDALERPIEALSVTESTVRFRAEPLEILTIALGRRGQFQ